MIEIWLKDASIDVCSCAINTFFRFTKPIHIELGYRLVRLMTKSASLEVIRTATAEIVRYRSLTNTEPLDNIIVFSRVGQKFVRFYNNSSAGILRFNVSLWPSKQRLMRNISIMCNNTNEFYLYIFKILCQLSASGHGNQIVHIKRTPHEDYIEMPIAYAIAYDALARTKFAYDAAILFDRGQGER